LASEAYLLEMEDISKAFAGVQALDHATLRVKPGTVHALVGENGAGKSTLMKILLGIYTPDSGKIIFKGEELHQITPEMALNKGISMIHQELSPVLDMRVCDNIYMNREPSGRFGLVNDRQLIRNTRELFESLHFTKLDPAAYMRSLSMAEMQMVEIAKAVSYNSDLIIMDEPTSSLTEAEVEMLFQIIDHLRDRGISIIYISHKMDEIFRMCDEITVFRDGRLVGSDLTGNLDLNQLFSMMVNRDMGDYFHKSRHDIGDPVLTVSHLTLPGKVRDVSFTLRRGEILGFAGLVGAGRTEIVESIFGLHPKARGTIAFGDKQFNTFSVSQAIDNGMALATEDRKTFGLFLGLSVRQNISICSLDVLSNRMSFIRRDAERQQVEEAIQNLKIKTPGAEQLVYALSGGNQQKIVLAKWLATEPDILILDEPTRGIDVGSKAEIYQIMDDLSRAGKSIIMISSEMPEIIGMSDRVLVVQNGRIAGELTGEEIRQDNIIRMAAG